jgi:cell division septal protein FtsQ
MDNLTRLVTKREREAIEQARQRKDMLIRISIGAAGLLFVVLGMLLYSKGF